MHQFLCRQKLIVPLGLAILLILSGCHNKQAEQQDSPVIIKTYDSAPISLTLQIDKTSINVAQQLKLHLTAVMPEDYAASFPDFPDKANSFRLVKSNSAQDQLTENGTVTRGKTYVLEAFLAGRYTIPALTIKFSGPDNEPGKITTESINIEVTSLLAADEKNPDIGELSPVVNQPHDRNFYILVGLIILLGIAVIFLLIRYLRRRGLKPPPSPTPADDLARRALDKLLAANLLERGEIKLFHQQVSDILRSYIENRFGLQAPERTTEEFLYELGHTDALHAEHKGLLHDFLTHCDLVKFAEHIPAKEESMQAVELCRLFIAQTRRQSAAEKATK